MTKLNVIERLSILQILPKENNFSTLKLIRDLNNKIGMSADELKKFGVVQTKEGQVKWNSEGVKEIEIELKEKESDLIVEALKELDKEKKLSQVHLSLYEKFVKE